MSEQSIASPPGRGSFTKRFFKAGGDGLLANMLAIASICAALSSVQEWVPLLLGGLSLALAFLFIGRTAPQLNRSVRPTGSFTLSRSVVIISVSALNAGNLGSSSALWIGAGLLALVVVLEASVARVARGAIPYASSLPGVEVRNKELFSAGYIFPLNCAAIVAFAVLVIAQAPAFWLILIPIVTAIPTVVSLVDGILRIRSRRSSERRLSHVLQEYEPLFAVHWDAPRGTTYQLGMWMPFLERLGEKFIVIVRNQATFTDVAALTNHPVLLRKELADMDAVVTPSLKAAFYVNTATKNAHFVRYTHITQIQLNHGDSDKAPSYNPVFRMFDKNFVAGQAAIDRFAQHGVHVPLETFSMVGRPQVESIVVVSTPISDMPNKTVLYAPTWAGFYEDSNYSSLPIGFDIVANLIERGCRVIFRSHPYTKRNKQHALAAERIERLLEQDKDSGGADHVWGDEAEHRMTIVDCFNESNALIADVSSVIPDFLYSEKPFALTAMRSSPAAFAEDFPIAKAAYVINSDLSNLSHSLDDLLRRDPLQEKRREIKVYYLGDFPAESYADAFLAEARKYLK